MAGRGGRSLCRGGWPAHPEIQGWLTVRDPAPRRPLHVGLEAHPRESPLCFGRLVAASRGSELEPGRSSLVAAMVKNLPTVQETRV